MPNEIRTSPSRRRIRAVSRCKARDQELDQSDLNPVGAGTTSSCRAAAGPQHIVN